LGHGDGSIQVDNSMPPASRHEHGFSRVLNALYHLRQSPIWVQVFRLLQSWKNEIEIMYGLIVFSFLHQMFAPDESLEYFWSRWYQNPSFKALHRSIPRAGAQWVLMDFRS